MSYTRKLLSLTKTHSSYTDTPSFSHAPPMGCSAASASCHIHILCDCAPKTSPAAQPCICCCKRTHDFSHMMRTQDWRPCCRQHASSRLHPQCEVHCCCVHTRTTPRTSQLCCQHHTFQHKVPRWGVVFTALLAGSRPQRGAWSENMQSRVTRHVLPGASARAVVCCC